MNEAGTLNRTLVAGVMLVLLIGIASYAGLFRTYNMAIMDRLFLWMPTQPETPRIMLVELSDNKESDNRHHALLKALNESSPARVLLIADSVASAKEWQRVLSELSQLSEDWKIAAFPEMVDQDSRKNVTGLGRVVPLAGNFRLWRPDNNPPDLPAFQAGYRAKDQNETGIIDFTMGAGFIPKVTDRQVLSGSVPRDWMNNAVVLVGSQRSPGQPGFTVPFAPGGISLTELQGYILFASQQDRFIKEPSLGLVIAFALVIVLFSFVIYQWLEFAVASLVAVALATVIVIANYITLSAWGYMLPVSQCLVVQVVALLLVYQLKRHHEEASLKHLVAQLNARLAERIQPQHFNQTEHPWNSIINFVNQQLNLKRSIFLERVSGEHRLKEIAAINCELEDIAERRRDFQRSPYSDALEAGGPCLAFRDYFSTRQEDELEFLAPLEFGGELLGFWAASLVPDKHWNQQAFENNMRSFGEQIGELLYHRKQWQRHQKRRSGFWFRVFSLEAAASLQTQIRQAVRLLETRQETLEHVFNKLSVASVLYDIFGQVIHTNPLMERLARQQDKPVFQYTATEFLSEACDLSLDEARKKIRYVVLKHQNLTLNAASLGAQGAYVLHVRPLVSEYADRDGNITPFQVLGILFELIDISDVQERIHFRQHLLQEYFHLLRNDMAAIGLAAQRLEKTADPAKREFLLDAIDAKLRSAGDKTSEAEKEVETFVGLTGETSTTVNLGDLVTRIVEEAQEDAETSQVEIEVQVPRLSSLVVCDAEALTDVVRLALRLLIEDAQPESLINVFIYENTGDDAGEDVMLLHMDNAGHGMDMDQLGEIMETTKSYIDVSDPLIQQFAVVARQLEFSGSKLKVRSDIGSGFAIDIWLKLYKFIG